MAQNDVELVIRARNLSTRTIRQFNDELKEIEQNQERVADANKLAERSYQSLVAEQNQLLASMKALSDRSSRLNTFERQRQDVDRLEKELRQARGVLNDLAQQYFAMDKPTKEFTDQMARAQRVIDGTERQLTRAQNNLSRTGEALRAAGVDTNRLEKSQAELNAAMDTSLRLYKQAERNVENYDAALQAVRAEQKATADSEKDAARVQKDAAAAAATAARESEEAQRKERQLAELTMSVYRNLKKAKEEAARAGAQFNQRGVQAQANASSLTAPAVGGGSTASVAANMRAILDPAKEVVSTLDKLEAEVKALDDEFNKLTPEILETEEGMEKLADQSRRLREAANALKTQANLADELSRTNVALTQSQQRFAAAQREVSRYAQQVAQADEPNDQLAASLQRAETELRQAHAELVRNTAAFNKVEEEARQAGVTVQNLANVEQRLATTAKSVTTGQNNVARTMTQVGQATERTTRQFNAWNNSQRTALSLYQRSRGQVLSLVSQYAGLFGAINLAGGAMDAAIQRERILSRLRVANANDARAAGEDFDYIRRKADELGLVFGPLAEAYSKFSVAARDAGQSTEATRFIFEAFTEASAALRLSSDESAGVFRALEQIFSKGAIQAEELRQQLGDRLTGAFNLFSKAIGVSTEELDKMLDKGGLVKAEFVLLAAQQARGMYGEEAKKAADSFIGDLAKMQNAWDDLKRAIIDGGFGAELRKLFQETTAFFKSEDGKKFADNLAKVFAAAAQGLRSLVEELAEHDEIITDVADAVAFLAKHLKELILLYAAIEASKIIAFFVSLALQVTAARKATLALNTALAVGTAGSAAKAGGAIAGLISGPIAALLAIAAAGIIIPIYLQIKEEGNQEKIRQAGVQSAEAFDKGFRGAIERLNTARTTPEVLNDQIEDAERLLAVYDKQRAQLEEQVRLNTEARKQQAAIRVAQGTREHDTNLGRKQFEAMRRIEEEGSKLQADLIALDQLAGAVRAQVGFAQTDLAQMQKDAVAAQEDALAADLERLRLQAEAAAAAIAGGDDKDAKRRAREEEKLAEQRIRMAQETADAIRGIDDDLLRAQDDRLENRIALVKSEFSVRRAEIKALIEEARELGLGDDVSRLEASLKRLDTLENITVQQTTRDFNSEKVAANEQKINDLLAQRQTELETINLLVEAGLLSQTEASERIEATNARMLPQMQAAVQAAQDFVNTLSGEEAQKAQAALDAIIARVQTVGTELSATKRQVIDVFVNAFGNAFRQFATLTADVIKGIKDGGDAWKEFGDIVLNAIADILIELGQMILMQALFNMLKSASENAGGAWGSIINSLASMIGGKMHTGGIVGAGGATKTTVPSYVFANAVEYHNGGIAGLKPDEVPTILQRNEEVLTEDDPRHRFNGGGGGGAVAPQEVTIVNTIESESVVVAGMATRGGRDAVFNVIKANQSTFQRLLGVK